MFAFGTPSRVEAVSTSVDPPLAKQLAMLRIAGQPDHDQQVRGLGLRGQRHGTPVQQQ